MPEPAAIPQNPNSNPIANPIPQLPMSSSAENMLAQIPTGKFFLDLCAGSNKPLSNSIHQLGYSTLPIDVLLASTHDLLIDDVFEVVLRVAASGQAAYIGASPSSSAALLESCVQCLIAGRASGGHGHLEQPKGALSWQNTLVQEWLQQHATYLCLVAACRHGQDVQKTWLFASSYEPLTAIDEYVIINLLMFP